MWLCSLASVGISVHVADCLFWRRRSVPPSVLIRNAADHRQPSCGILKKQTIYFPWVLYRLTPSEDPCFILGFVHVLLLLNYVKKAANTWIVSVYSECLRARFVFLAEVWTSFSDVLFVVTLLFYSHVPFRDKVVTALRITQSSRFNPRLSQRSVSLAGGRCNFWNCSGSWLN